LNRKGSHKAKRKPSSESFKKLDAEAIETLNLRWEDNEATSLMWELISSGRGREFLDTLREYPEMAHVRSADGRGPMWWAHEYKRPKFAEVLKRLGVSDQLEDSGGRRPGQ